MSRRSLSWVWTLVLFGGAAGAGLSALTGFRCPWRSMGLACPGCGCTRAAVQFFTEGPLAAFRDQPTALLLLISLAVSSLIGVIPASSDRPARWLVPATVGSVVISGAMNLAYQLRIA